MPVVLRRKELQTLDTASKSRRQNDFGSGWDWAACLGEAALLLLPFMIVGWLLRRTVDVGKKMQYVPNWVYLILRGCGLGSRLLTAGSVLLFLFFSLNIVVNLGGLYSSQQLIGPGWLFALSLPLSPFFGFLTHASRCATAQIIAVKPVTNATANELDVCETLMRPSQISTLNQSAVLVRPVTSVDREDGLEVLGHVSGL